MNHVITNKCILKEGEGLFEQIRKTPPINSEEVEKFWEKLKSITNEIEKRR